MLGSERAAGHVSPKVKQTKNERKRAQIINGKSTDGGCAKQMNGLLNQIKSGSGSLAGAGSFHAAILILPRSTLKGGHQTAFMAHQRRFSARGSLRERSRASGATFHQPDKRITMP